ncbi:LysM peptidoglycan-binding domain-containing protein [Acidiferrimicrobium sp. IK]|uniref:BTAD domain-containing putative transcriptional regulator n=1 Tax=Acidiferrimicrobium sp. IK TaxID=2871700 RepID=UPI0021CB9386|nr:BTAD domain-containing putative transcriptional regulator [Acidiferrimicrobium sp. IK]MCU4187358.1 LysM peptidoglycan-binding domain-containing protein [Acidiferrimicrobium sp. IK]
MARVGRVLRGFVALGLLAALVVGIPWALWHFIGWPLPHHVPSIGQVGHALNQRGIPDQALLDALAVVVWITWATLVASIAVEIPAALSGRHPPRLPLAGMFQPITGRLVAAVIVAALTLAPRPAHGSPSGSLSGNPSSATVRRPVAALVLKDAALNDPAPIDAVLTRATRTLPTRPPSPEASAFLAGATPSGAPVATQPADSPSTYVVQRGDTLWGIAERQLGDPLEWQAIYQLNEGRPQPDGATLTDPHWIDPGWTLLLPDTSSPPPAAPVSPPPLTTPTSPTTEPPATTLPPATTPGPANRAIPTTPTPATGTDPFRASQGGEPVRLPSGSVVAGSFAAGVLSAVALGRLRRRHAYRYRPPEPGRDLTPEPLRPTLCHLARVAGTPWAAQVDDPGAAPAFPFDDTERRQDPGRLEVGCRNGETVTVELTDLSGTALCGPSTDDIVRAVVAGLLVRADPGAVEVLLTTALADRLLPGLGPDRAIRRAKSTDDVARAVEAETIARTRRLDAADAADAASFREENPENPLPLLVVLLDSVPDESRGRWSALLAEARRLGIAVVFLDDIRVTAGRLVVDASRTVTDAEPHPLAERLGGVQLFGLRGDEAAELLGSVTDANRAADDEDEANVQTPEPTTVLHRNGNVDESSPPAAPVGMRWPEPSLGGEGTDRPLVVEVLGPYRIAAFGEPVTTGLRGRAKTLLAWCLLRPEGATIGEVVDALWPDTPPDRVLNQFWHPLGDLRAYFRGPAGETLDVLEKVGEHYRPNPAEMTCDLWDFQTGLAEAARATDDESARQALRRAVDAYRGDLLAGSDYPWVEPVRQDLHRRALDSHLRLAEIEDHAGHPDAAVDTLERVIDLDRYAEEPYRRLMTLHAAHGRLDAVTTTWQFLQRRLADLDVDGDDATARLYRSLTTPDATSPGRPRPIRLSS